MFWAALKKEKTFHDVNHSQIKHVWLLGPCVCISTLEDTKCNNVIIKLMKVRSVLIKTAVVAM